MKKLKKKLKLTSQLKKKRKMQINLSTVKYKKLMRSQKVQLKVKIKTFKKFETKDQV